MTATEILNRSDITEVWRALGGDELRHGRGKAFWRDGSCYNVTVNTDKGTWYDHVAGEGGGILSLIQRVRGGTAQDALKWLAEWRGLPLDGGAELTEADKRDFAADKRDAELARLWRRGMIVALSAIKAEAYLHGHIDILIDSARHLYSMEKIEHGSKALLESYRSHLAKDRHNVERYVRYGREDEAFSAALTKCAVGALEEAECRQSQ